MLLKFFLIYTQINFILNCEDSVSDITDTSYVSGEYLNIFRTIPTLFEYVLDVIEQKPEILEKDDVTVFTEDTRDISDQSITVDDNLENLDSDDYEQEHMDSNFISAWFPGVVRRKRFDLSWEEIAEMTLEVEKQLEEHNEHQSRT